MEKINFQNGLSGGTPISADNLNLLQTNVENAIPTEDAIKIIILATKPIGSIEINTTGLNPSEYIGGTWEVWGSGRVPVGVDTAQTEFATAEKTGGEKTHTHTLKNGYAQLKTNTGSASGGYIYKTCTSYTTNRKFFTSAVTTTATDSMSEGVQLAGKTDDTSNLQPYITCYMWKRTA